MECSIRKPGGEWVFSAEEFVGELCLPCSLSSLISPSPEVGVWLNPNCYRGIAISDPCRAENPMWKVSYLSMSKNTDEIARVVLIIIIWIQIRHAPLVAINSRFAEAQFDGFCSVDVYRTVFALFKEILGSATFKQPFNANELKSVLCCLQVKLCKNLSPRNSCVNLSSSLYCLTICWDLLNERQDRMAKRASLCVCFAEAQKQLNVWNSLGVKPFRTWNWQWGARSASSLHRLERLILSSSIIHLGCTHQWLRTLPWKPIYWCLKEKKFHLLPLIIWSSVSV